METVKIQYAGAEIEILSILEERWPFELHYTEWPSFCGPGEGLGDWIIPDTVCGVWCAHICFDHDFSWSLLPKTIKNFYSANIRFYLNVRKHVYANSEYEDWRVEFDSLVYFLGVAWNWKSFKNSKHAESKLIRLESAVQNIKEQWQRYENVY